MARGLLHRIVSVTASVHSPTPPPSTIMPPPPLPAPDDGGFSPLPAPRPPSTELELAHSTTVMGSGSIVDSVTSASPVPSHRRELQTAVSTVADLTSALANTAVAHIVLAPGTYNLIAELSITRSVILEAAVAGSVVLDAQASSSSQRRVLNINPGSSGVVQVIGLNITGGYTCSSNSGCCWAGSGVYVNSGTVTIMSSSIYGNTAAGGFDGGGVFVQFGTVSFINCQVYSNQASSWGYGTGGGVYVLSGTVSIASSSIYGNTAGWGGSNVHVNGGTVCTWATTLTGVSGTFGYVFRENVRDVLNKHNDTHVTRTLDYLSTQC